MGVTPRGFESHWVQTKYFFLPLFRRQSLAYPPSPLPLGLCFLIYRDVGKLLFLRFSFALGLAVGDPYGVLFLPKLCCQFSLFGAVLARSAQLSQQDSMSEWSKEVDSKSTGRARAGSNPAAVDTFLLLSRRRQVPPRQARSRRNFFNKPVLTTSRKF
jgi:hypothetical protein